MHSACLFVCWIEPRLIISVLFLYLQFVFLYETLVNFWSCRCFLQNEIVTSTHTDPIQDVGGREEDQDL
jgi:hypothetical protein